LHIFDLSNKQKQLQMQNNQEQIKLIQSKINAITRKAIKENSCFKYGNILNELQNQLNTLKTKTI
jgi:Tfp pilus assembly PilM family ATPase